MTDSDNLTLLTVKEVCARVHYTRAWIYVLEQRGQFPRRVQVGPNRVAWLEAEIDRWIMKRVKRRKRHRVRL